MKTGQEKMDRAQRRQRRLDQRIWGAGERAENGKGRHKHQFGSEASNCESVGKPGWKCNSCGVSERDTPMRRSGPAGPKSLCNACGLKWQQKGAMGGGRSGNVSAEESTDDVTVYEAGLVPSTKGLQAQLNLSDARGLKREKIAAERAGLKWERIAAERAVEIKELKNEIQSLKLVIEEIRESKEVQVELESKLRAENQNLKEKNSELTSGMEVCMQLMHDKIYKKNSDHAAGKGPGNAGRNAHESIAEVNVCNGDQDKGHQQPSKQTGNSGRNGFESAADVNVDIEQQGTGCHQGQQTQHLGGNGSGIAKAGHANGSPNECLHKTEKSASLEKDGHDSDADVTIGGIGGQSNDGEGNVSKEPQQAPSVLDMKSGNEPEVLFTAAQRKAALALVDQEFLMWLNSRTRRPTAKEMFFHKSNVDPDRNWSPGEEAYLWTGIPGSLLLDKFHTETDMEKPDCDAVITLLKSVFHIVGGRRADDMLWCLVWADCIKAEQLPGYTSLRPYDTKRARAADDELATRSGKVRRRRHDRLD